MQKEIIVLKLGSSVLKTQEDLPNAVHEIYRWYRSGSRVVAVVSAIGETTDHLVAQSIRTWDSPDPWASAELLATGERASAALLGVALDRSGVPARIVDPREIGLTVAGSPRDSEPVSLDAGRLHSLLATYPVVVIPGFFGAAPDGRVHLLGRGGSDLSAVFLANRLGAALCRLVKDVDGIYDADPAFARARAPQRFAALSHADALRVAGRLIQPKAVSYLQTHGASADVAAPALPYQSRVHGGATELAHASVQPPLRVLILGLGTVGFGVYQRLVANPEHFQVEAAVVRNRAKYEALGVPSGVLVTENEHLRALRPDIVVDALPGIEPSRRLVDHFLATGADVVSANKTLIAEYGDALAATAARSGATLRYSASVGGSSPMIEWVSRIAAHDRPASLAAVLNGTCNFVLDCCSDGATLQEALDQAKQRGFAEDDPSDDLSGRDAARKLRILVRHGFGARLERIEVEALDESIAEQAQDAAAAGMRLRQISRASTKGDRVAGCVRFERVARDSALGELTQERNGLEIVYADGRKHFVAGRGAGRWPTTEAVMADLFDVRRQRWTFNSDEAHAGPTFAIGRI
jgi:homoserine dehydrogenase